jgi:mercuric reductase
MKSCAANNKGHYDLVIIGSGSAAFAGAIHAAELGKRVAMIERSTLGGTCVNVGCVPSKTLIRAAEAKHRASHHNFNGITSKGVKLDFSTIIREKDALVDSLRKAKYKNVLQSYESVDFIEGDATFSSKHEIKIGERIIKGGTFLIATGARPYIPPVPGLDKTKYLTSTTAFELKELPASMAIIGGRYIALELAQMFQRMGSKVTILQRSNRILPTEDPDLTNALTAYLEDEGMSILTGVELVDVTQDGNFTISAKKDGVDKHIEVEQLIVATGRRPNTAGLNLQKIGVDLNDDGSIVTNEFNQTSQSHIYAAGDVIGNPAFVYTAANEGKLAVKNAFGGNITQKDYSVVPYVVFTDPQVAGVGLNEQAAQKQGIEVDVAKLTLDNVPRSLAARDTRGFIKLLKKKGTDYIVGASILAPEGSELLMEIAMAIKYKIPVKEIAAMFHPYLTLGESIKLAAQTFDKDVKKLSCCAS